MFEFKSYRSNKFLITLIVICFYGFANAQISSQGLPYIVNFSPREYRQESQNYSIAQDKTGLMYFGNLNGIMLFDNSEWRFNSYTGRPILCSGDNDVVYAGGYNRISKLKFDKGKLIIDEIDLPEGIVPGQIQKVLVKDNSVLFCGANDILNYENDTVKLILNTGQLIRVFDAANEVYISLPEHGLFVLRNENIVPVRFNEFFTGKIVIDVVSDKKGTLFIKTHNEDGFYKVENGEISYFNTQVSRFIRENGYVKSKVLSNGSIVTGTVYGGLVCVDSLGQYSFSLNKRNGLLDNHITDIFVDNNDKVWITTYNGITHIETPSSFSFIDDTYGLYGAISTMIRFKDRLYYGTTQGVFYGSEQLSYSGDLHSFVDEKRFSKVNGITAETQFFKIINNQLVLAASNGLYQIDGPSSTIKLLDGFFRQIYVSDVFPNIIYISGKKGLLICNIEFGNLVPIGYVNNLEYDIRTIAEQSDGTLWLGSNNDGYFRLVFNENDWLNPEIVQFTDKNGLPEGYEWADVVKTKLGLLFSTAKGIYNYSNGKFIPNNQFGSEKPNPDYYYPLVEDYKNRLWFNGSNYDGTVRTVGYFSKNEEGQFVKNTVSFSKLIDQNIECIYCDSSDIVFFGGFDGLVRHNNNYRKLENNNNVPCIIKQIILPEKQVVFADNDSNLSLELTFSQNTIRFNYTALFYGSYQNVKYQTRLHGFQDSWSEWGEESFREFTNLRAGQYEFSVRGKDSFGRISEIASFEFIVKPPIYFTWWAFFIYVFLLAAIIWLVYKLNEIRHASEKMKLEMLVAERTNELVRQKEQTEKLVQKLLPRKTVQEIKETGTAQSRSYKLVTVLFADIEGFTKIAEDTDPEKLIGYLNEIFTSFDTIIAQYNIEKIKTIGDAYMCAGGMPDRDRSNPVEVIMAALEMLEKLKELNSENGFKFNLRIGIHTGDVIAGVVGAQKLEYDIWGDTVNTASRMESHGIINRVNISTTTFEYVKEFYDCELREKMEVKYKGGLEMYLVKKIKQHLSEYSSGKIPNRDFFVKVQTMRLNDLEEHMYEKLDKGLPKNLYYHNLKHTINVYYRVEMIGREEKVSEEELLLLKTAAIFHDAGFMVSYDNNEQIGAKMAEEILITYKYTKSQIEIVKSLIMSTKMPPRPKTHLEMIMCDADLDYLGRPDFSPVSQNLFRELFERGKISTIEQWNRMQYRFILKHNYFTATARKLRDPGKQLVLIDLKKKI
jgi:class 3 adenylate cyclase